MKSSPFLMSLWDMLELHAAPFLRALGLITKIGQCVSVVRHMQPNTSMEVQRSDYQQLKSDADEFHDICVKVGLPLSALSAERLGREVEKILSSDGREEMKLNHKTLIALFEIIDQVDNRVTDEFKSRPVLMLSAETAGYYKPPEPLFGLYFKDRFAGAQYDLDEAGKCLAIERSTAAVFHSMRIVELGIGAMHSCLGIKAPLTGNGRNWGNILGRIKDELFRRGQHWHEYSYFQELYVLLDAIKHAWRNATMHVENKYTEEEALEIFQTVKSLMKRIASRMDEHGQPPV